MSTCVMKQDNKVGEEKKSLHLISLHLISLPLGVKRNAPIIILQLYQLVTSRYCSPHGISVNTDSSVETVDKRMMSVFYGSSKNQCIVLKVGRILIVRSCMHQVTSALTDNGHELVQEWMSLLQLKATFVLVTVLWLHASPSRSKLLGIECLAYF